MLSPLWGGIRRICTMGALFPFLLQALLTPLSCTSAGTPASPPLLQDLVNFFEPSQAARVEELLSQLHNDGRLEIYILTRVALAGEAPEPPPPWEKSIADGAVIEITPSTGEVAIRRYGSGETAKYLNSEWEDKLRERMGIGKRLNRRAADQLELSLREIAKEVLPPSDEPANGKVRAPHADDAPKLAPAAPPPQISEQPAARFSIPTVAGDPGPQSSPEKAYLAYLGAARSELTNYSLALYTPQTQNYFKDRPLTREQLRRMYEKYRGMPYEVVEQGDYAVIHFPSLDLTYAPFFFAKGPQGWQVDFYTVSQTIRTSASQLWRLASRKHPYMFAFAPYYIDANGFVTYRERAR